MALTETSPFCEAKGGRVERSETQGVHTIARLNPFNSPFSTREKGEVMDVH